jgi:hypothetical protein
VLLLSVRRVCVTAGFLALIVMRVLKSDYARYARADDEEDEQVSMIAGCCVCVCADCVVHHCLTTPLTNRRITDGS